MQTENLSENRPLIDVKVLFRTKMGRFKMGAGETRPTFCILHFAFCITESKISTEVFMDNIADILSSLSPDDIENLKATAESIFGANTAEKNEPKENDLFSSFDPSMIQKIMTVMSKMNSDNSRSDFIKALKPHLSTSRQKKADEAMKILKLMDILPLLQNLG